MKLNKIIIIISIVIIIFIVAFVNYNKDNKNINLKIDKTSYNFESDDQMIQILYNRYHLEDGLKFRIAGSDQYDYYTFYYKDKKVTFNEFPDIYKIYILLDTINYSDYGYDDERKCYKYPLEEFKDLYFKNYGSLDDFSIEKSDKYNPQIYLDENEICISDDDKPSNNYTKIVDTYMVNAENKDDKIIIYERVAFIDLKDGMMSFYGDYQMKKKVYSLKQEGADMGFINNSKLVSNVLISYQDKFPLYKYTYIKGNGTYYLESISLQILLLIVCVSTFKLLVAEFKYSTIQSYSSILE